MTDTVRKGSAMRTVWVEHLRSGHPGLAAALDRALVLVHPWVAGELALGSLTRRQEILGLLRNLPQAVVATAEELSAFIERHRLYGLGNG
jgi:predicted nucleic acid-binding protein